MRTVRLYLAIGTVQGHMVQRLQEKMDTGTPLFIRLWLVGGCWLSLDFLWLSVEFL